MSNWQMSPICNCVSEKDAGFNSPDFRHPSKTPEIVFKEGINDVRKGVMKVHSIISLERMVHPISHRVTREIS